MIKLHLDNRYMAIVDDEVEITVFLSPGSASRIPASMLRVGDRIAKSKTPQHGGEVVDNLLFHPDTSEVSTITAICEPTDDDLDKWFKLIRDG